MYLLKTDWKASLLICQNGNSTKLFLTFFSYQQDYDLLKNINLLPTNSHIDISVKVKQR